MITKIISGGQTGADRAALDVAIKLDVPHGGWIAKGRKTEDGALLQKYKLQEMPTESYPDRTEQNVIKTMAVLDTELAIYRRAIVGMMPDGYTQAEKPSIRSVVAIGL